MSENEIKPVAWVERSENGHDRMWSHSLDAWANRPANPEPLYSQSAFDRLTAERDELRADAERWRHARRILAVEDIESSQDMFDAFGAKCDEHWNRKADAAIDAARAQEPQE